MHKFLLTTVLAAAAMTLLPDESYAIGRRNKGCNSGCGSSYCSTCSSCSTCSTCSTCAQPIMYQPTVAYAQPIYQSSCSTCSTCYQPTCYSSCDTCGRRGHRHHRGCGTSTCSTCGYGYGAVAYGYGGCSSCGQPGYIAPGAPMMAPGSIAPQPLPRSPEPLPRPKTGTSTTGTEAQ